MPEGTAQLPPAGALAGDFIENRIFDEMQIGDTASLSHCVTQRDIDLFAEVSGDVNPAHVDPAYAETDMFHHIIIHGMWGAGLISAVLGTKLPGPGTIYLGQDLRFRHPVSIGDTITATLTVQEKKPEKGDVTLACVCTNQHGEQVITGSAFTRAPAVKIRRPRMQLPYVRVGRHAGTNAILARAGGRPAVPAAIVFPVDAAALQSALASKQAGFIVPVLIGPAARLQALAAGLGADISALTVIDAATPVLASAQAVSLARSGKVSLLIKGDLHTEDLMHAVVAADTGLRTDRRVSHVYMVDVPDYPRPLLLTDVAINVRPNLLEKAGIVQNAIDFAHAMGIEQPRVAILAAVETVTTRLQSTLDAAALCKMADRGQITGGMLDGPLAFDNAINAQAAAEKGIVSPVAGQADILLVPDLESGNMLAKQLTFLAGAEAAGLVLGTSVPIVLSSRADSPRTRLASCALGVIMARHQKGTP